MKKTRSLLAALLLLGALASCAAKPTPEPTAEPTAQPTVEPTAQPTQEPTAQPTAEPTIEPTQEPTAQPTEEPTVEPTEDSSGLEAALVNVAVGKTCYLTTVGQADSDIVGNVFKKAGAIGAYETQTMLKASDVAEGAVVFLTLGSSSKGLGAAGVDETFERARAAEFAAAASEGKFTLILFHVGGTARRGTSSDPIIEAAFPGADACFVVASGNEDAFFTNLASTNNVSLYEVEKALLLVEYAKGMFGK